MLYCKNLKNFQRLYPNVWGVTKLSDRILVGDSILIQDYAFMIRNKIDLIIVTEDTAQMPPDLFLDSHQITIVRLTNPS